MTNTTVSGNTSVSGAGGIDALGKAAISRSTISGNTGGIGGVLAYTCPCYGSYGADISNSTVYGNHAKEVSGAPGPTGYGGGVYLGGPYQSTISNSTIAANTATNEGGGVFTYGNDGGGAYDIAPRAISSTIVAGNSASGSPNDLAEEHSGAAFGFTAGNSLIQNKGSAPVISDPAGSNIFNTSPGMGTLADNGGPTLTQMPALSSPAINAGVANGLAIDQRGKPRTANGGTDIGSVEREVSGSCNGVPATIDALPGVPTTGTSGPDVIVGTSGPDEISSLGGDDVVCGLGGDDQINAGNGDDAVYGGAGKDAVRGGDGDDSLTGNEGADTLDGLAGDDLLGGGAGTDTLMGRGGDDELRGRNAADLLQGGAGDDLLAAGNGADVAKGGGGADLIKGGDGTDELRGAGDDDEIRGAGANDSLFGGAGANHLNGGAGKNKCLGGPDPGNVLKNCN